MQFIDEPSAEILLNCCDTAANSYVALLCSIFRTLQRRMDAVGDEVKRRSALHLERFARMVGQDKRRDMIWRFLARPPFHESSGQGPRTGPNMFRPRIHAPTFSIPRRAHSLSMPVEPPSWPCICFHVRVEKNHSNNSGPRTPSGLSRLLRGPADEPSIDTANALTRTLAIPRLLQSP